MFKIKVIFKKVVSKGWFKESRGGNDQGGGGRLGGETTRGGNVWGQNDPYSSKVRFDLGTS